jgi:fatty acid hydroxylase family protein
MPVSDILSGDCFRKVARQRVHADKPQDRAQAVRSEASPPHQPRGGALNWFLKPEEALMLQTVSLFILNLSLFLMTAVATHLVMSFWQTLIHYKVAHHPMGGKIFRNHINFHHTHYSDAHLVSRTYLGDEGNTTPYFFIPVSVVGGCAYFLLPLNLFVVMVIASAASFYAHVFFDKEYHVEGSRLQRFAWFRRKQELHFVHHRHANSNFGVIHFFWDKILGTYRKSDFGA